MEKVKHYNKKWTWEWKIKLKYKIEHKNDCHQKDRIKYVVINYENDIGKIAT